MDVYTRLTDMGISVETADMVSRVVCKYSERMQDAFCLWAEGYTFQEIGQTLGMSKQYANMMICGIKNHIILLDK